MRLSNQAFIIAISKILISMSGIIGSMILSRYLLLEEYGTYKQIWLIYNTFSHLLVLGINTSVPYHVRAWTNKDRPILFMAGSFISVTTTIFGIALFFSAPYLSQYFNNPSLTSLLKIFSIYPFLILAISFKEVYFISKQKPYIASISTIFSSLLIILSSTVPVIIGYDLEVTFSVIVLVAFCQFIFYLFLFLFYNFKSPLLPTTIECNSFFKLSFSVGVGHIILLLTTMTDKYFISYFFSPGEYAIYANGAVQIPFETVITVSIMSVLFPKLVELKVDGQIDKLLNYWHEAVRKASLLLYPIYILLFILAEELLVLLFGDQYISSSVIFRIYIFFFLFRNINFSTIMLAYKDLKIYLLISFSALLTNFILNIIFIKFWGFKGPAYSTVLVTFLLSVTFLIRSSQLLKVPFFKTIPSWILVKIFTVACLCAISTYLFKIYFFKSLPNLLVLICCSVIFLVLYFILGSLTNLIRKEDFSFFKIKNQ